VYHAHAMGQTIRFCTSADGVRIAFAQDGSGPPLVRAAFYMNHLELDRECLVWKPYLEEFGRHHTLLRHDMRGFGLSDAVVPEQSVDAWVHDLEAVVDAAGVDKFPLVGTCHGTAIAVEYAARHPERVTHLVLFGAFGRGGSRRVTHQTPEEEQAWEAVLRTIELGWGTGNEAFQQIWPTFFQPCSTYERLRGLAELQRQSANPANAVELVRVTQDIDVEASAPKVKCPTLILQTTRDRVVPFEEGRRLASLIPGAKLVALDSDNHVLTNEEPAWQEFVREFRSFLPTRGAVRAQATALHGFTARELDILERMAQGLDNAQIAAHLDMSEKTVRNYITRIYDKLGVENRPQAIVRAREAGLGLKQAPA